MKAKLCVLTLWTWASLMPALLQETLADSSSAVCLTGADSISPDRLLDHLEEKGIDLGEAQAMTRDDWERGERLLRQYYQDQGYPLARVEREAEDGHSCLRVVEGPRADLGWLDFEGNQAFSDEELAQTLDLGGRLDFGLLEERLEAVRQRYRDTGYPLVVAERGKLQVQETLERSYFPLPFQQVSKLRVRLEIKVEEGPRFRFGSLQRPPVLQGLGLPDPVEGEYYSERRLLEYRRQVGTHFASEGRLIREFQILQRFDADAALVHHRVKFSLYPPLDVSFIRFQGHDRYPDSFYRREMELEEERRFDPRLMARSLAKLNSTGVLKRPLTDQDVELTIDEADERVEVVIHLEEKKPRGFFYSLSRNDLGGLQVTLLLTVANWMGLGEELGLSVEHGGGATGAAVGIASRYLLGTDLPVRFALRFFRRHTGLRLSSVDEQVQDFFRTDETGFSGVAAYRVRSAHEAGSDFAVSWLSRPNRPLSRRVVLRPFWTWRQEASPDSDWIDSLRVSSRVSFFDDPSQAWNWSPRLEFRREGLEAPLQGRFRFRFQAAYSHFGEGSQLLSERLFTDADTVRGFSSTTSGPWRLEDEGLRPLGGDTLFAFNSEYEVPLNETFVLAPFFDSGINFAMHPAEGFRLAETTNGVWRASLGGELRIKLPAQLPAARLVAAWNPLRMEDVLTQTVSGLSRLRDPRTSLRLAFDPVF
ncbi:MAG TPA: POTRA domain-containing protein [Acidobacteriota bacterium]|nr:POTRA domain-containing protein [Acidobacteriota bacterium]